MTVYSGELSHKYKKTKNNDYKTGSVRHVEGVTDNKTFASIFGNFSGQVGGKSANGKTEMIEIFSDDPWKKVIYVDASELTRIDDLVFLKSYKKRIKMWRAVANYLEFEHREELQSITQQIDPTLVYHEMTDKNREVIAKVFLEEISLDEANKLIVEEDKSESKLDLLQREVIPIVTKNTVEYHGMQAIATISVFSGKKENQQLPTNMLKVINN